MTECAELSEPMPSLVGMIGAMVTTHPSATAIAEVFFLPDGDAGFYFVDDVAAGIEGGVAVVGGDAHDYSESADFDRAGAVDASGLDDLEFFVSLGDDPLALFLGEEGVGFVFEPIDGAALMVVSYPSFEGAVATGSRVEDLLADGGGVEGGGLNFEHRWVVR